MAILSRIKVKIDRILRTRLDHNPARFHEITWNFWCNPVHGQRTDGQSQQNISYKWNVQVKQTFTGSNKTNYYYCYKAVI